MSERWGNVPKSTRILSSAAVRNPMSAWALWITSRKAVLDQ